jgi:hypothetical protein
MAQLQLDIVVNDSGAVTALRGVEQAVRGVESAGGAASTAAVKAAAAVQSGWANAGMEMKNILGSFASFKGMIAGLGVSALIADFLNVTSKLTDLRDKTGLSLRELQRFSYAGDLVGVTMEQIANAISMFQNRLGGGNAGAIGALKQLGLGLDMLKNLAPGQQFELIATAVSKIEDPMQRAHLMTQLFGRSGRELLPLVRNDLQAVGDEAERVGAVMADDLVENGDRVGDVWSKLGHIGTAIVGTALKPLLDHFGRLDDEMAHWETFKRALGIDHVLSGWRTFIDYLRIVRGTVGGAAPLTPTVPGSPSSLMPAGLPQLAMTDADARSIERELNEKIKEQQRAAEERRRRLDAMTGRDTMRDARQMIRDLRDVGGLTVLTDAATKDLHKTLGEALEAYSRLGEQAPQAMIDIWRATMPALQATQGLANVIDKLPGASDWNPFSSLVRGGAPPLPPVGTGVPAGLPGAVNWNPFESISKPDSFLTTAFGDLTQVGRTLGLALVDGLSSASDKIRNVFKSLAVNLGDQIGSALSRVLNVSMSGAGFFSKGLGKMIGGIFGSLIPMIGPLIGGLIDKIAGLFGNAGRDIVKDFAASKGGFDALHNELLALGQAGEDLWITLTQGVGRNNPEQAKAAVEEVTAALERHKQALQEAMSEMPQAVVARSANITSQHDFSTVGAEAMGTFAFLVQQGQSAIAAFQAIAPAVEAMRVAMQGNNFEMTVAAERLFALDALLTQHKVQFDNIAASGALLSSMLKANIMDSQLFAAVSGDIGTQIQSLIDSGVSTQQVFALAQPQLQAIWEAQQRWHFEVDATTQSLIDQAAQQGFVGEHMKSVNEQILAVLVAIGKVLGADIPQALAGLPSAAQAAADGMNNAFKTVRPPKVDPGEWDDPGAMRTQEGPDGPRMHAGGMIGWRRMHGGGLASDEVPIIGQSGEFVMSRRGVAAVGVSALERMNRGGSAGGVTVNLTVNGSLIHEDDLGDTITRLVMPRLPDVAREYGVTGRH